MPYLQLAESGIDYFQGIQNSTRTLAENNPEELYIWIPDDPTGQTGKWVREDYFDGLTDAQWEAVMGELADFQPTQMNGIFDRIRENIAARRQRRDERRSQRQESRMKRIEGREGGLFGGKLKGFISSLIPGGDQTGMMPATGFDTTGGMMTRDPNWNIEFGSQPSWFDRNKGWVLPVGGLAILGTGYLIYKQTKK